jgi:hypothetical protein
MSLYKELISKGKDVIAAIELPFKVKEQQKNLEMEILKIEQQIAKDELTIQEQKSKHPVDWKKLIDSIDDLDLNKKRLSQLNNLEKELFKP